MEIKEVFYPGSRADWRAWLSENFRASREIWLAYRQEHSLSGRLTYNDMVEEALCFGWIDSTHKKMDAQFTALRFTPRRKGSPYSQLNIERLKHLLPLDLIHPSVLGEAGPLAEEEFVFPPDIIAAIRKNPLAWENFCKFPEGYKRLKMASIAGARQDPELFRKRLAAFILKTEQNKFIKGLRGMEKYF